MQRLRDAWPEVLAKLEKISRSSWLVASNARVVGLKADVLTLSFQSQSDVATFKDRTAGPSEDLRTAIHDVLDIRVKYIARHDTDTVGDAGDPPPPPDDEPADPPAADRGTPAGATARATAGAPSRAAAAPVTDWAVAAIPTHSGEEVSAGPEASRAVVLDEAPVAQFAVDDEPEDAASVRTVTATIAPPIEGDVLPDAIVEPSIEPDEDEAEAETLTPTDTGVPAVTAPPTPVTPPADRMQRYGEAVVRQVLHARFIREEPYEPPTRFG